MSCNTSPKLIQSNFAWKDVDNVVSTVSYTMFTVTSCRLECCVPSGLDFEAAGDSIVRHFVCNYLLRGLQVAINMMWTLFRG